MLYQWCDVKAYLGNGLAISPSSQQKYDYMSHDDKK